MVLAPEANGVVVVGRDDMVDTPMGMGFSTLAGTVGGGSQVPGFMGIGKRYIISRKFLRAEGGILRLVWMPAALKATLQEGIVARAVELGEPDFLTKIATEENVQDLDGLLVWLEKVHHPVLQLEPMF
jgi:CO dehydrogenase/acetyl-CoA synthase beta subunit